MCTHTYSLFLSCAHLFTHIHNCMDSICAHTHSLSFFARTHSFTHTHNCMDSICAHTHALSFFHTHTHSHTYTHSTIVRIAYVHTHTFSFSLTHTHSHTHSHTHTHTTIVWTAYMHPLTICYGVATMSRLLKIIGLFCKRALENTRYSAKETYHFKEPTNRSHPIALLH